MGLRHPALFLAGVRRLDRRDERALKKSRGFAAQLIPSAKDRPPFAALADAFTPLLHRRARYGLEVRHDLEGFRFLPPLSRRLAEGARASGKQ